jgi:hypothetical protein
MAMEVHDGGVWAFTISEKDVKDAKERSMTALQALRARRLAALAEQARNLTDLLNPNSPLAPPRPQASEVAIEPPPFMATPLHDLESLFWMFVWTIDTRSFYPGNSAEAWQLRHFHQIFVAGPKAGFLKYSATIIHWITSTVDLGSSHSLVHTSGFYISIAEALVEGYKMLESSKRGELNHLAYADQKTPRQLVELFSYLAVVTDPIPLYECL